MGDYWNDKQKDLFISSKKILALVHAIRVLKEEIRDATVHACIDSKVMSGAWEVQGGKTSNQLMRITKQLFREVCYVTKCNTNAKCNNNCRKM